MMIFEKIVFAIWSICLIFPVFATQQEAAPSVLIKSAILNKQPAGESMTVYGRVMTATGATENISFPRAGQVVRLFVVAGQVVKRGQKLLDFATDQNAVALYHQTKTAEVFARGELMRVEDMAAHQLATQSQLATARKALQDAQANLTAQNRMGNGLEMQQVRASFAGVVSLLSVQQGDRVISGVTVLQLSSVGKLRATLGVEPEDASRLRAGMPVQVSSVFGNQPPVTARLLQIHGIINPLTRLVDVDVELQGDTSGLLPGMQVRGTIVLNRSVSWVVPRSAVLRDEQGGFLFQVRSGHAVRVPVTVTTETGNSVAVNGALNSALRVVVSGNYELQDGMLVRESHP